MGKRLTYEQRVLKKMPNARVYFFGTPHGIKCCIENWFTDVSSYCIRERDAWRSAWRNLKGRK